MPSAPDCCGSFHSASSKPFSSQPATSLSLVRQCESVGTKSGSPSSNSTLRSPISPAGFLSGPTLGDARIRGGDGERVVPGVELTRHVEELDLRPALSVAHPTAVDKRDKRIVGGRQQVRPCARDGLPEG